MPLVRHRRVALVMGVGLWVALGHPVHAEKRVAVTTFVGKKKAMAASAQQQVMEILNQQEGIFVGEVESTGEGEGEIKKVADDYGVDVVITGAVETRGSRNTLILTIYARADDQVLGEHEVTITRRGKIPRKVRRRLVPDVVEEIHTEWVPPPPPKEGDGKEGDGKEGDGKEGDGKEGDGKEGQEGDGQKGDGQEGGPEMVGPTKFVQAVRRKGPVSIDGKLTESAWTHAPPGKDFVVIYQGDRNVAPHEQSEFRILYDDDAVYIGVRAYDSEPDSISAPLTPRDQLSTQQDVVSILIGPRNDRRSAYGFTVNPRGSFTDFQITNNAEWSGQYNAVFEVSANIDDQGWSTELRIPYSQLGVRDVSEQSWSLRVDRFQASTQQWSGWTYENPGGRMFVSTSGEIQGFTGMSIPTRLELVPYAMLGALVTSPVQPNPVSERVTPRYGLGLDLKLGLPADFLLTAAINPDFGQVEADPAQFNISDNEIFFQERRPFFSDVGDLTLSLRNNDQDFGSNDQLFHSRRIGGYPTGSGAAFGDFMNPVAYKEDDQVTIYGAGKIEGEFGDGNELEALTALAAEEKTEYYLFNTDERGEAVIEPLTSYNIAQLSRVGNEGRSRVRVIGTGVHRELGDSGLLLHRNAVTGGLWAAHRFGTTGWEVSGRAAGSHVRGSEEAILDTQLASQRYFQRPNAPHVAVDPTRNSLTGGSFALELARWPFGSPWHGAAGVNSHAPGFEPNDIGFLQRADQTTLWGRGGYLDAKPGKHLQEWHVTLNAENTDNWAPERLRTQYFFDTGFRTIRGWHLQGYGGYARDHLDTSKFRGGPGVLGPSSYTTGTTAGSPGFRKISVFFEGFATFTPETRSRVFDNYLLVTFRPTNNFRLDLGQKLLRNLDDIQYIGAVQDPMDNTEYVVGRLSQWLYSLSTRAAFVATPTFSIELYSELFTTAGQNLNYKLLADPDARSHEDRYQTLPASAVSDVDDGFFKMADIDGDGMPDIFFEGSNFNFQQLASTVSLRWRFRPGSELIAAWNQRRDAFDPFARFRLGRDLGKGFTAEGQHLVLVKLYYWWSL